MKPRKNTILILLLGLLLVAFASGMAQTPAQGDQKKKAEACCSMESCCCNGGSCPSGDSCDIKAKHDTKNHGTKADCCHAKHKASKAKAKQKSN